MHRSNPMSLTARRAARLIAQHTRSIDETGPLSPLVSVCVLTYNHAKFIRQALDSVLMQQTNFPYEVVIGEDCSTDGTREIVLEYQARYPDRIRVLLSTINLGHYTGNGRINLLRNFKACRGTYIAMLEGDDYWTDPLKLQKQMAFLEEHNEYVGCFHDTLIADEDGSSPQLWREYAMVDYQLSDTISTESLCHTSAFVYRSSALLSLPPWFRGVISGDMAMFFLVAMRGALRRIPEVMSVYRKHAGGVTAKQSFLGLSYDARRMYMQLCFKRHLRGREDAKSREVIAHHACGVAQGPKSMRQRLRRVWAAHRVEPRLLLHPPAVAMFARVVVQNRTGPERVARRLGPN